MPLLCTKLIMGAYFNENVKDAHDSRLAITIPVLTVQGLQTTYY